LKRIERLIRSWVNSENHALLAVTSLSAEEPEWGSRVDLNRHGGRLRRVGGHGLEARVDATGHWLAGCGECRLRHGVVLGEEDELDRVAHVRLNLVGRVVEPAATDLDLVGRLSGRGGDEGGKSGGCEGKMHLFMETFCVFGRGRGKAGFTKDE